jgi:hypothetical protein
MNMQEDAYGPLLYILAIVLRINIYLINLNNYRKNKVINLFNYSV